MPRRGSPRRGGVAAEHAVDARQRLAWTARCIAAGFILGLALTPRLWLTSRLYPLTPVAGLPAIPPPWDALLYALLIAANVAVLIAPLRRDLVMIAVFGFLAYSLWDQQRWVPFFNEMAGLYLAIALRPRARPDDGARDALAACAVVIALIYVWSGLQKLNPHFLADTFPWMMGPFMRFAPGIVERHLAPLGLGVALLEITIGVMLLTARGRRIAVVLGILMHTFILLSAGPLGNNGNTQIWSWNVIAGALLVLVYGGSATPLTELMSLRRSPVHTALLVFFGMLPIFNFVVVGGFKWDDFQAATLYSGNESQGTIYIPRAEVGRVPPRLRDLIWEGEDGRLFIRVLDWAYAELNVPDYHAERIYLNVMRTFCGAVGRAPGFVLEAGSKADALSGDRRVTSYACAADGGLTRLGG